MTIPFRGLPTPPSSNAWTDTSKGIAGLVEGLMQGRRQRSQDALAEALKKAQMAMQQRQMQHMAVTEAQGQQSLDQTNRNNALLRLAQEFPQAEGNLSILLDQNAADSQPVGNRLQSGIGASTPDRMTQFGQNYAKAVQGAITQHAPQSFEQNGQTFTVPNKEFNPSTMMGLGFKEDKMKVDQANRWRNDPTNKITMSLASNFSRAYAALKSAETGNPAAYNSALLNFATAVDPTLRSAQWTIKKMTDIDPSLMGKWDIFVNKLKSGQLPDQQDANMVEHLKSVITQVMSDYDQRRQAWIVTNPGLDQDVYTPSAEQLFPLAQQEFLNPASPQGQPQGQKPSIHQRIDQLRSQP